MSNSNCNNDSRIQSAKDSGKNSQNNVSHVHGTPLPPKPMPKTGK